MFVKVEDEVIDRTLNGLSLYGLHRALNEPNNPIPRPASKGEDVDRHRFRLGFASEVPGTEGARSGKPRPGGPEDRIFVLIVYSSLKSEPTPDR